MPSSSGTWSWSLHNWAGGRGLKRCIATGCVWAVGAMALSLSGCSATERTFERQALHAGLTRSEVMGGEFRHALYVRPDAVRAGRVPIHVYLTGDGTPYIRPGLVAADPTPRHPVVVGLLARDPAPAMILGRPCYHGYARVPPCTPEFWTQGRYGERVVAGMAQALTRVMPPDREYVLIGFSGGGALAVLLARRLPKVIAVVTLAGNLDTDAWAHAHDYGRLDRSLNPVQGPPLSAAITRLHYAGARDRQVPPVLVSRAVARIGGEFIVVPDTSHERGWEQHWGAILADLERRLHRRTPPPGTAPGAASRSGAIKRSS
jgi:hypothetical protein